MNILGQKEKKRLVWLGLILVLSVLINLVNSPNLEFHISDPNGLPGELGPILLVS